MTDGDPLLTVSNLAKYYRRTSRFGFRHEQAPVRAVDGISFDIYPGETLALVGETGCGKSTTAETVLGLEPPTEGEVRFDGENVGEFDSHERKRFRRRVQMIFQDPTSSLDPRMTIGESVGEPLLVHGLTDRTRRRERVESLLERVGLSSASSGQYPHELSGGQKQRAALARALVLDPDLLIADEPVNALDASVQAEFLSLLEELSTEFGLSVLFISHDLAVVRAVADRSAVMYLGEIVERGPTEILLRNPDHPYTRALVDSMPVPDPYQDRRRAPLSGDIPDPSNPPEGCRFHTRCPAVIQPEETNFEPEVWHSLVRLRHRLATGNIDAEEVEPKNVDQVDTAGRTARLRSVREAFDLPSSLGDDDVDRALDDILEAVIDGQAETALERFEETFPSVCIGESPQLQETGADHEVACHLF